MELTFQVARRMASSLLSATDIAAQSDSGVIRTEH
jgi:hypothetical protein